MNKLLAEKCILVVEDDFDLLWLIKKILTMNGFQVLTAVTAEQAIVEFSKNIFKIDGVILDVSLPDKNGQYLCKEFLKVVPDLPVIITTGFEDRAQRREFEKMGVKGYLVKPFDLVNLVMLLSKFV
ncbi:MAG: response regulator [Calditrichia bacterium]